MKVNVTIHYNAYRFFLYNSLLLSNCNAFTNCICYLNRTSRSNTYFTLFIAFMKSNFENNN